MRTLIELLASVRTRLRVTWAAATAQWLAPAVVGGALFFVVVGRFRPWAWPERAAVIVVAGLAVALFVVAIVIRISPKTAARAADRGLRTKDAFATALEVADRPGPLPALVVARAESLARGARPRDAVPLRWAPKRLAFSGFLGIGAIALAVVANPQDDIRRQRQAERAAVEAEAERLRDAADDVAYDAELGTGDETVAEALNDLAQELEQGLPIDEAQQRLDEARQEFNARVTPELLSQQAAAQGLNQTLDANPLPGASGDSASEQFEQAAAGLDELTPEESEALAERLESLAATQAVANPALAESLQGAAAALASGDVAGAAAALGEAAAAQSSSQASVAGQQANAAAAAAVADARARLDRAGPSASGQAQGQGQGSGEGEGEGEGQGEGQGQGQGQGQGSGQGQGQGAGSPSGQVGGTNAPTGQGQGGVGNPDGSGFNPSVDLQFGDVEIFDPGTAGDQLGTSGTPTGNEPGQTTGRGNTSSQAGGSYVPLADVFAGYQAQATDALDRTNIPPSLRALVRAYFDRVANVNQPG